MDRGSSIPARLLKPQYIAVALVPLLIVAIGTAGNAWAHKGVTVSVDGESSLATTRAKTVGAFLDEVGVEYDAHDLVTPAADAPLEDGSTVLVRHAVPVELALDDEVVELDVIGSTVADVLVAAGLDAGAGVTTEPSLGCEIEPGMRVVVTDVFVRVVQEETEIAYSTETTSDPTIPTGTRAILVKGKPGVKLAVYKVVVADGVETERTLVTERITAEPVSELIGHGTMRSSGRVVASRYERREFTPPTGRTVEVEATGYAPNVDGVGTRTATGDRAGYGIIAVDPNVIPLGTKLYIPGYGFGVAADTGGAIKGRRIDLCYNTGPEAIQWGRRDVTITIIE